MRGHRRSQFVRLAKRSFRCTYIITCALKYPIRSLRVGAMPVSSKTESMLSANVADYNFSSTSDRQNVIRDVSKLLQHEQYDKPSYKNDVALVTLSEPIKMQGTPFLAAILPPVNSDVAPRTTATVAGWGRLKYGEPVPTLLSLKYFADEYFYDR